MIHLRSEKEIDAIRHSCQIVVGALNLAEAMLEESVTTLQLSKEIEKFIVKKHKARPAFKGYQGFPGSACISVDDEVVHGIPNNKPLKTGSLVKVDVGVESNGFYGDAAKTFVVGGKADPDAEHLMKITKESLKRGINKASNSNRVSDISYAIQSFVENAGYSVVRELVGHGIGRELHEEPQVPNFGDPGKGPRLKSGMVIAIEPMVNRGTQEVTTDDDGWTVRSADGSLSAHYEHTVAITKNGALILTEGI